MNAGRERKSSQKRSYEPSYSSRSARDRVAELRQVAELEQRVAGVGREPAEHVGPQHRHDHRAVAAARLAGDPAVRRLGERPVARVDERDDLVAEVLAVAAGARRVDELRAAVRRPGVDGDDERRRAALLREQPVDELRRARPECGAVLPHVELPGHALDQVDRGEAPVRLGVVRRAGRRPRAAGRAGRRAGCRAGPRSRSRARRSVPPAPATTAPRAGSIRSRLATLTPMAEYGTMRVKSGLAEMLKGGVIMDVVDAEQAKIAEDAGAVRRHGARARPGRHPPRRRRRAHVRSREDPGDPGGRDDPGHGEVPHRPLRRGADPRRRSRSTTSTSPRC